LPAWSDTQFSGTLHHDTKHESKSAALEFACKHENTWRCYAQQQQYAIRQSESATLEFASDDHAWRQYGFADGKQRGDSSSTDACADADAEYMSRWLHIPIWRLRAQ
jgi:hypothetical protein